MTRHTLGSAFHLDLERDKGRITLRIDGADPRQTDLFGGGA